MAQKELPMENVQGQCMTPLPLYQSHKKVWALKIASVTTTGVCHVRLTFHNPTYAPIEVSVENRPMPKHGWYYVAYKDGYHSFCPGETFEADYKAAGTFLDRLKSELEEVQERRQKLRAFVDSQSMIGVFRDLPLDEQFRLEVQLQAMTMYVRILSERITKASK